MLPDDYCSQFLLLHVPYCAVLIRKEECEYNTRLYKYDIEDMYYINQKHQQNKK